MVSWRRKLGGSGEEAGGGVVNDPINLNAATVHGNSAHIIFPRLQAAKTGVLGPSNPTVGDSQGPTKLRISEQGEGAHVNQQQDESNRSPVAPGPYRSVALTTDGSGGEIPRRQTTSTIA